jgi:hypothetical protein
VTFIIEIAAPIRSVTSNAAQCSEKSPNGTARPGLLIRETSQSCPAGEASLEVTVIKEMAFEF